MPLSDRPARPLFGSSHAVWLTIGLCTVVAFAWQRGAPLATDAAGAGTVPVAAQVITAQAARQHAVPAEAGLGLSTIEIIVGRNDTLERIFRKLRLSITDLATLRAMPDLRAHLDRLHPGEQLRFRLRGEQFFGFERKLSPSETLHVTRAPDGFATDVISNPLEKRIRATSGVIDSSLFQAADAAGISDSTALAIADIFAWDIDFVLDIQPGDSFRVTYEQLSQDGAYVSDGDILAVEFVNAGRSYQAVRYVRADGTAGYYTPEGKSLRKAFIRAPVQFTRVSSRFNSSRLHPVLNLIRAHRGTDYAAPAGTPVRAAGDGRVRYVGRQGGYGNVIELSHAGEVVTVYGHLSRFAAGVSVGDRVQQGQLIGYVGMTGLATGPHLHYEYRVRGVQKDPQRVPLPTAEPVPAQLLADFQAHAAPLLASLVAMPHAAPMVAAR